MQLTLKWFRNIVRLDRYVDKIKCGKMLTTGASG